jgi:hypothetical protein
MFSKVLASQVQAPDRDEPLEAAKIPLKNKGMDIASQMRLVKKAEPNHASALGHYSTSVDQTLGVIEAIEATLQQKRRQIEEIQTRQEILALEYRQLGRSLDTATKDLAQQFADIITDLETDKAIAKPPADKAPGTNEPRAEPPSGKAAETNETGAEPPADSAPETDEASGLDLETSDLPPVPEFLGERQDSSDQMDDDTSRNTGSGPGGWWKHAKKG